MIRTITCPHCLAVIEGELVGQRSDIATGLCQCDPPYRWYWFTDADLVDKENWQSWQCWRIPYMPPTSATVPPPLEAPVTGAAKAAFAVSKEGEEC